MYNYQFISPQQVLIECKLVANGANTSALNPFDEQDYLIRRPIVAIQAFTASDMPNSPLGGKLPVIPDALFPYAFLNINRSGYDNIVAGAWYKWIPLCSLRNIWNNSLNVAANLDKFRVDPMTIQWRDTNIAFPTPQLQAQTYSVPLLIDFLLPEQDADEYRMAFPKGGVPAHKIHGMF